MNERASEESADELSPPLISSPETEHLQPVPYSSLPPGRYPAYQPVPLGGSWAPGRYQQPVYGSRPVDVVNVPVGGSWKPNIVRGEPERPNKSDESSLKVEEANKTVQIPNDRRVDRQNFIPENANGEGSGDDITSRLTKMVEAKISPQNLDHDSARSSEEKKVKDKARGSAVMWCCFRRVEK